MPAVEKNNSALIIKTVLITVVVLLVTAGLVYAGFWYGKNRTSLAPILPVKQSPLPKPTIQSQKVSPIPSPVSDTDTSQWLTYVNQRFHYSVRYPPEMLLGALGEGDNPLTEDVVEVGDEGTFILQKETDQEGMKRSMIVFGRPLTGAYQDMTLEEIVNHGSYIDPCQEEKPEKLEKIVTKNGTQGIKAWYWVKKGCQGAKERFVNDPYVFFDARPTSNTIIEFFAANSGPVFEKIVPTFQFIKPQEYGD